MYRNSTSSLTIDTDNQDYIDDIYFYCWTMSSQGGTNDFIGFGNFFKVIIGEEDALTYAIDTIETEKAAFKPFFP